MHAKKINLEFLVFIGLLLLWLIPVWSVDYFVTGDGPCHLYNSKILVDWHFGNLSEFYKPFLRLNRSIEPNFITNIIQVILIKIFPIQWVEKIFFTLYVVGFAFGFRFLIRQINPNAGFLSALGMVFAYHHILMMGFENNSYSIVFWFWATGFWLYSYNTGFNNFKILTLSILFLLLFLSHPIGLFFGIAMIGSLIIGHSVGIGVKENIKKAIKHFVEEISRFTLALLPTFVLFFAFFVRRDWHSEPSPNTQEVWKKLFHLTGLINLGLEEENVSTALSVFCLILLILFAVMRIINKKWDRSDGLIIFVAFSLGIIFFPPSSISAGLEVPLRLSIIPFIALIFWAATATYKAWIKWTYYTVALGIMAAFLFYRLPAHRQASDYAKEIMTCAPSIKDKSTLLTLNYDWTGHTTDGKEIANAIWLFNHVDCYLGTVRSLIISDNYEANFWYFPLIEKGETNMYKQTDKDGVYFDNRPPRADILNYKRRTGQELDYVLMISYTDAFRDHPYTREIFDQLNTGYDKIFTSEHSRAILYKRKGY